MWEVCSALAAALVVLSSGQGASAFSPWKHGADLLSGVADTSIGRALGDVGSVAASGIRSAVGEVQRVGRTIVKGATHVAGRLSGATAGRFLELVGLNSTCAGEAAAGCRRVVDELVTQYLDVDDVSLTPAGIYEALKKRIAVHPGTKWCGAGNVARSEEDAGVLAATDACCRRHDECPENLVVGEERYGLRNTGRFTRSHCECDREFYQCLKNTHTLVSLKIGILYFSILRPQCYERTYPIVRCKSHSLLGTRKHEQLSDRRRRSSGCRRGSSARSIIGLNVLCNKTTESSSHRPTRRGRQMTSAHRRSTRTNSQKKTRVQGLGLLNRRSRLGKTPHCSDYELDVNGQPRWQWFDNPTF